jgi:hemerythrin
VDLIVWTPDLATGSDQIDDQHKQLFKAANALAEAMWDGKGQSEVTKTIDFLADYTVFHFGDEEKIMLENAYPGYALQKQSHEKFISDITALRKKFEGGEVTSALAIEVLTEACNWFRSHIKMMDAELGGYLKNKA